MTPNPEAPPTLADAIEAVVSGLIESRRGPLPARVVLYAAPDRVDCVPTIWTADTSPPTIRSVPVAYPMSILGGVHFPLSPGDVVYLVPAERSTDEWQVAGTEGKPSKGRRFSLADVVAIPSIRSLANPPTADKFDGVSTVVSGAVVKLADSTAVAAVGNGTVADANNTALLAWISTVTAAFAGLGISSGPPPTLATESLTRVKGV